MTFHGKPTSAISIVHSPPYPPIIGMFEMLWERGIPHADYTPS
jgi:hypothetical protein